MSDVSGFSTPPVSGVVRESKEQHNDKDPEKKVRSESKKHKDSDVSEQTLDEWAKDHTSVSLLAIEIKIFEELQTLLHRYSDEIEIARDITDPLALQATQAYQAYQKQAEKSGPTLSFSFPSKIPDHLALGEKERYQQLEKDWRYLLELRSAGIEEIPYNGQKDFLEALEEHKKTS